ncbi:MAG: hypothetical protein KAJ47_03900 [Candidatus Aenigmarchaeota archaeon]|nr:hypothetical protein [Candidatus Aenigmarchaeota archaeon]
MTERYFENNFITKNLIRQSNTLTEADIERNRIDVTNSKIEKLYNYKIQNKKNTNKTIKRLALLGSAYFTATACLDTAYSDNKNSYCPTDPSIIFNDEGTYFSPTILTEKDITQKDMLEYGNISKNHIVTLKNSGIDGSTAKTKFEEFQKFGFNNYSCTDLAITNITTKQIEKIINESIPKYHIPEMAKNGIFDVEELKQHKDNSFSYYTGIKLIENNISKETAEKYIKIYQEDEYFFEDVIKYLIKNNINPADIKRLKDKGFIKPKNIFNIIDQKELKPYIPEIISERNTKEIYRDNLIYTDFKDLKIPRDEKFTHQIPKDMALHMISENRPHIEDIDRFSSKVFETANKLGYSKKDIKNMNPKEAIELSQKIVCENIKYYFVDDDKEFKKCFEEEIPKFKWGYRTLPHDRYFEIGLGDCDKYSALNTAVFDLLKKENRHLKNVYVFEEIGGTKERHSWNSVLYLKENKAYISHINPQDFNEDILYRILYAQTTRERNYLNSTTIIDDIYKELENYQ